MANLTEISVGVRKIGIFAGILIVSFVILRFIVILGIAYYKATHMPPEAPPDIAFGKIPKPKFADYIKTDPSLIYSLENIEGKPPETTASARIFSMPKKTYTFESGEQAKLLAKKLGFETQPRIDTVYYYYSKKEEPLLTLLVDGTNLNFQYKFDYTTDPSVFKTGQIPSVNAALTQVKDFINYNSLWDKSIASGKTTSENQIYDTVSKKMKEATSLSTAQAVRVNFFREDIDSMKLLPDGFRNSHNYVLFAPNPDRRIGNVIDVSYFFWPIDTETFGSYPLLSSDEAYKVLTDGKAMIVDKGNNENNIIIRKIYLAYFDPVFPQMYLQPIFVFEGDNDFVAYVPAVRPEHFQ